MPNLDPRKVFLANFSLNRATRGNERGNRRVSNYQIALSRIDEGKNAIEGGVKDHFFEMPTFDFQEGDQGLRFLPIFDLLQSDFLLTLRHQALLAD